MQNLVNENLSKLSAISVALGSNPRLIQGAGGNTSFKTEENLWIKASGMWLSEAANNNIFVKLDLSVLREQILSDEVNPVKSAFSPDPNALGLRPSIETTLHGLLASPFVVHTHPIDVIAIAVRDDAEIKFARCLDGMSWVFVPYARPGMPLTRAMQKAVAEREIDVVVLGNHGLVVGGADADSAMHLTAQVCARCAAEKRSMPIPDTSALQALVTDTAYRLPGSPLCHILSLDNDCQTIAAKGSLYPDHVVFLGHGIQPHNTVTSQLPVGADAPLVLTTPLGTVVRRDITAGAEAMVQCLAEVLLQVPPDATLNYLSIDQEAELINWDAEKLRQMMNR